MGSGASGLYTGTHGSIAVPGSTDYMRPGEDFSRYIRRRKDIDIDGFYDIVAHGTATSIQIQHGEDSIMINHRIAARLFASDKNYKGQGIRLLSCNTGKLDTGFAQNLANKLGVPVKAPTEMLWATPSGKHYVAAGKVVDDNVISDLSHMGKFKTFYPKRRVAK